MESEGLNARGGHSGRIGERLNHRFADWFPALGRVPHAVDLIRRQLDNRQGIQRAVGTIRQDARAEDS
jgi:hypothetical protein